MVFGCGIILNATAVPADCATDFVIAFPRRFVFSIPVSGSFGAVVGAAFTGGVGFAIGGFATGFFLKNLLRALNSRSSGS